LGVAEKKKKKKKGKKKKSARARPAVSRAGIGGKEFAAAMVTRERKGGKRTVGFSHASQNRQLTSSRKLGWKKEKGKKKRVL